MARMEADVTIDLYFAIDDFVDNGESLDQTEDSLAEAIKKTLRNELSLASDVSIDVDAFVSVDHEDDSRDDECNVSTRDEIAQALVPYPYYCAICGGRCTSLTTSTL